MSYLYAYRCRLCAGLDLQRARGVNTSDDAINAVLCEVLEGGEVSFTFSPPTPRIIHYCTDGCIGVADFVGIREAPSDSAN